MAKAIITGGMTRTLILKDAVKTCIVVKILSKEYEKEFLMLLNNIEQVFGKPRRLHNIGSVAIKTKRISMDISDSIMYSVVCRGSKVANEIFVSEITKFCEES